MKPGQKNDSFPNSFSLLNGEIQSIGILLYNVLTLSNVSVISLSLSINIFFHCRLLKHSSVNVDMNKKGWDPLCSVCAARV